jgi:hypothetical protein
MVSLRGAFFVTKQSPQKQGDCFAIARNDKLQAESQVELDALTSSVLDRALKGEL